jgi:hypothetical protein
MMPLPFEQQPRETSKAYAAFREYLDLGPQRSLVAVGQKLGKSRVVIERWSSKFDWVSRVQAHTAHLAELERKVIEARVIEKGVEWCKLTEAVKREAWKKGDEILAMADDFLERWRECSRVPGFESIVRGIELAIRLKQFAAGIPTETKEVHATVTGTVDIEWEAALKKIYGAAAARRAQVEVAAPPANPPLEVEAKKIEDAAT